MSVRMGRIGLPILLLCEEGESHIRCDYDWQLINGEGLFRMKSHGN